MFHKVMAGGAIVAIATVIFAARAVSANDAADAIAEKFARESERAQAAATGKKEADRKAAEKKKREDELKAEQARRRAAVRKTLAARRAAEIRKAMKVAAVRRAAEQRKADEEEMLARARREVEEMRATDEQAALTAEARRLIERAERERAKAEELLAAQAQEGANTKSVESGPQSGPSQPRENSAGELGSTRKENLVESTPKETGATPNAMASQRAEEARRLAEKLSRIRQIREAGRLARDAGRQPDPPVVTETRADEHAASTPQSATAQPATPSPTPEKAISEPAPVAVAKASPNTETSTVPDDATPISPAPKSTAESGDVEPKIVVSEAAPTRPEASPEGVLVDRRAGAPAVTVLLVMTPGNYGIRRGNKTADPVLCTDEGCYIGGGPDKPARLLPIWQALGFGNTWGKRAGACNHALGCVFRGIQLGQWPARVQPVDLHILKHDRRRPSEVSSDSGCRSEAGRLACANGVYAESYAMWIVPESVAEAAGPAALQRALTEGLSGPRSAEVSRLSR